MFSIFTLENVQIRNVNYSNCNQEQSRTLKRDLMRNDYFLIGQNLLFISHFTIQSTYTLHSPAVELLRVQART